MSNLLLRPMAALLVLAASLAAQNVLVVAPGAAGDFSLLADAVAAADSGDTILVRGQDGPPFSWPRLILDRGISLDIVGDGEQIRANDMRISGLPAGETVRLQNLEILPENTIGTLSTHDDLESLELVDNEGVIWIESCLITGIDGFVGIIGEPHPGGIAVKAERCAGVFVHRSSIRGGAGLRAIYLDFDPTNGKPGLMSVDSDVTLHSTTLRGGKGGQGLQLLPLDDVGLAGGPGLVAEGSRLLLGQSYVFGGDGADSCADDPSACAGGHAIELTGPDNVLRQRNVFLVGGLGASAGPGVNAPNGTPLLSQPGNLVEVQTEQPRRLFAKSPRRSGELVSLRFFGQTGDLAAIYWSPAAGYDYLPGYVGTFALGQPLLGPLAVELVTEPTGQLKVNTIAPDVALLGVETLVGFGQAFYLADGEVRLSSPATLTVLDEAF